MGCPTLAAGGTGQGAVENPYAFHGGIKDPGSGLVKFGLRWYSPTTGAWTQEDTLDAPLDPANANRYAYAGDDPINAIDPSGARTALCNIVEGIAAGAVAVTAGALIYAAVTAPADLAVVPAANTAAALTVAAGAGGIAALGLIDSFLIGC